LLLAASVQALLLKAEEEALWQPLDASWQHEIFQHWKKLGVANDERLDRIFSQIESLSSNSRMLD
jgi:hypothetical protein